MEVDYIYYYGLIEQEIHDCTRIDYPEEEDLNDGYYIGWVVKGHKTRGSKKFSN